ILKPPTPCAGNSSVGAEARSKEFIEEDNTEEKPPKVSKNVRLQREPDETTKSKDEFLVINGNRESGYKMQGIFEHVVPSPQVELRPI
ncbi:hypothetical protein LOAG_06569, partial [Loa loa]